MMEPDRIAIYGKAIANICAEGDRPTLIRFLSQLNKHATPAEVDKITDIARGWLTFIARVDPEVIPRVAHACAAIDDQIKEQNLV